MESTKYHRLGLEDLPEPDYFDLELEKIYAPPLTRFERTKQWARRHLLLVVFLALFLVATVLYVAMRMAAHPRLVGIARPGSNNSLKELAGPGADTVQVSVSADPDTTVQTDEDRVSVGVAGSDVTTSTDSDDTVLGEADNMMVEASPANTTTAAAAPVVEQADNGQVAIQDPTTPAPANKEPPVPIKATFYSGSEGPKSCRGHVIAAINIPSKPQQAGLGAPVPTAPQCYNFPKLQSSGCATFQANKVDGCVAQVFAEPDCRVYTNTAAFMAEKRPVGGNWRSVRVQCGLPEPDPATLGKPPMMDSITSMVNNDKPKAGGR